MENQVPPRRLPLFCHVRCLKSLRSDLSVKRLQVELHLENVSPANYTKHAVHHHCCLNHHHHPPENIFSSIKSSTEPVETGLTVCQHFVCPSPVNFGTSTFGFGHRGDTKARSEICLGWSLTLIYLTHISQVLNYCPEQRWPLCLPFSLIVRT